MKNYILVILFIVLIGLAVRIIWPRNQQISSTSQIQVVVSFYPLYFLTQQIGGGLINVYNLTPPGVEPHDFEPTARDVARMETAKLVIIQGNKLEPWADKLKNTLENEGIRIVVAGENLILAQSDPHTWLSPVLYIKQAEIVTQALISIDPAHVDQYRSNKNSLTQKLTALDALYRRGLAACHQKDIITSHAAFGYMAKEYNFNQISISGLSPNAEPNARTLTDLINLAKLRQIKYIYFESLVSPKLSDTLAQETGARTLILNPIEGLTEMQIKQGEDYFTLMDQNLKNLQTGLECQI